MSIRPLVTLVGLATLYPAAAFAGGYGCPGGGCYRHVSTPPVYGSVAETVVVSPPRTYAREIPAEYAVTAERVMVSPGGRRWEVTRDASGNLVGCWVDTPPQFAVQHRRVMVSAPRVVHENVPGTYATRQRTVLISPGTSGWQPIGRY